MPQPHDQALLDAVVPIEVARQHARMAALSFIQLEPPEAGSSAGDLANWSVENFEKYKYSPIPQKFDAAEHAEDATAIYDIRGRLLFWDFTRQMGGNEEVRVRSAANEALGVPVISLGIQKALPLRLWIAQAAEHARARGMSAVPGAEGLVCYSYPKLGLLCVDSLGDRFVVDLADHQILSASASSSPEAGYSELPFAWSPLDQVLSINEQRHKFEREASSLAIPEGAGAAGSLQSITQAAQEGAQQRILSGVKLVGQETPVFCAVASAKMLLDFNGLEKTQEEIAVAMKTGPAGTTAEDQIAGYGSLSGGKLFATLDQDPSLEEAKGEIDAGRPFKTGIPGHARAIAGWKSATDPQTSNQAALLVYDPWPVNDGRIYWEFWGAVTILNYVMLKGGVA